MSGLTKKQEDILRLVASKVNSFIKSHFGTKNINKQMERFLSHKTATGVHIINVEQTYNKIKLAARAIAAVENPEDVIVHSHKTGCELKTFWSESRH